MSRYSLNTLVLFGVLSIASILVVQLVWVRKTMELQNTNIEIQEKEDSLNIKEFSEQSHVALRNVLAEINTTLADSSELYGAVKQIRSNRFMVDINEELQNIQKKYFDKRQVTFLVHKITFSEQKLYKKLTLDT